MLPAVAVGNGFTVTATVAGAEAQPPLVIVNEYVPASAAVAGVIVGSSAELLKLFGPVQAYVAEGMLLAERLMALPTHTGELEDTLATGSGFTVTDTFAGAELQPFSVTTKVYVPASAAVAGVMVGSSVELLKLLGPVHA